jgi:hypothetical protein
MTYPPPPVPARRRVSTGGWILIAAAVVVVAIVGGLLLVSGGIAAYTSGKKDSVEDATAKAKTFYARDPEGATACQGLNLLPGLGSWQDVAAQAATATTPAIVSAAAAGQDQLYAACVDAGANMHAR